MLSHISAVSRVCVRVCVRFCFDLVFIMKEVILSEHSDELMLCQKKKFARKKNNQKWRKFDERL